VKSVRLSGGIRRRLPPLVEASAQRFVGVGSRFRVWTQDEGRLFVISAANGPDGNDRVRVEMDSNGRVRTVNRWGPGAEPLKPEIAVPPNGVEILPADCSLGVITAPDPDAGSAPAGNRTDLDPATDPRQLTIFDA
jgi:hypothetical protein